MQNVGGRNKYLASTNPKKKIPWELRGRKKNSCQYQITQPPPPSEVKWLTPQKFQKVLKVDNNHHKCLSFRGFRTITTDKSNSRTLEGGILDVSKDRSYTHILNDLFYLEQFQNAIEPSNANTCPFMDCMVCLSSENSSTTKTN